MKEVISDAELVGYCGLYCGACGSYLKERCPGCHENTKAGWCRIKTCCEENRYTTCADCGEYDDPNGCGKFNNLFSKIVGFFTRSDRSACIDQIKRTGVDAYTEEMAKLGRQSLKK